MELFHARMVRFPGNQRQRHDTADMHIRSVYVHVQLQLLTHGLDVFETFLVIGACATDPNRYFVFGQGGGEFSESADDAFES